MNKRLALALLLLCAAAPAAKLRPRNARIEAAVDSLQPAVVKIFGAKGFRGIFGYMTGVIVHESGLLLTRGSVTLEEVSAIRCHLHDGRRRQAQVVREDRRSRMVLLKLVAEEGETFPVAKLGSSEKLRPGKFVLLFGNAYNVAAGRERAAVNLGVITAYTSIRMRHGLSDFRYPGKVILHDAMNNPGVYGGPLADLDGAVIGISGTLVESKETNAQVHYAIPIDDLKPFIEDTLKNPGASRVYDPEGRSDTGAGQDNQPGYHGIRILKGGINRATPAYVDRVRRNSPAAKAGLRPDDLVLQIDQTSVKSWKSFGRIMKSYRAGETARLTIKRGEEIKIITLTLAREEEEPSR